MIDLTSFQEAFLITHAQAIQIIAVFVLVLSLFIGLTMFGWAMMRRYTNS